jgi:hypothetical protein
VVLVVAAFPLHRHGRLLLAASPAATAQPAVAQRVILTGAASFSAPSSVA